MESLLRSSDDTAFALTPRPQTDDPRFLNSERDLLPYDHDLFIGFNQCGMPKRRRSSKGKFWEIFGLRLRPSLRPLHRHRARPSLGPTLLECGAQIRGATVRRPDTRPAAPDLRIGDLVHADGRSCRLQARCAIAKSFCDSKSSECTGRRQDTRRPQSVAKTRLSPPAYKKIFFATKKTGPGRTGRCRQTVFGGGRGG